MEVLGLGGVYGGLEKSAIILDIGSSLCKMGFAGKFIEFRSSIISQMDRRSITKKHHSK